MDEVIKLENQIRDALPQARAEAKKLGELGEKCLPPLDDAEALMRGKPTYLNGTRLERLRSLASCVQSMATGTPFQPDERFKEAYIWPWSRVDADPNWDGHAD
jgi:hypothetical protein